MAILNQNVEVLADKPALVNRAYEIVVKQIERAMQRGARADAHQSSYDDLTEGLRSLPHERSHQEAIAKRDIFTIALAGGSTPKPLYEALSEADLPWSKIHIFWGDERYVPADNPDSNQLMVRQAWLDKIDIPAENIHPMDTTGENPAQDAKKHEAELRKFFEQKQGFPKFDLILLGMGDDGHTASLFPQTEALSVEDSLVTVGNHNGQPRITLTVPIINQADCVVFLVAGENKRPALKQVFATQGDAQQYPSRLIQPQGELLWLLDRAAAEEL